MLYRELNLSEPYIVGPSSGTTAVAQFRLSDKDTLIAVENVAMLGEVFLHAAPRWRQLPGRTRVQPAVAASLERSLKEHAEVWAELSKY